MEHETIADPGPTTEERHAIAAQPTEMFDVEGQFEEAPPAPPAPADEELVDAEQAEPSIAPPAEEEPVDEFDEFFSEQRLSDELNQALEAPLPDEPGAPTEEAPAVFIDLDDEEEDAGPVAEVAFEDEEEPSAEHELAPAPEPEQDTPPPATSGSQHEDVLEDTPEFLEDAPEDDELWFEQKPPRDFDFD